MVENNETCLTRRLSLLTNTKPTSMEKRHNMSPDTNNIKAIYDFLYRKQDHTTRQVGGELITLRCANSQVRLLF
jgi:hypothetical protein